MVERIVSSRVARKSLRLDDNKRRMDELAGLSCWNQMTKWRKSSELNIFNHLLSSSATAIPLSLSQPATACASAMFASFSSLRHLVSFLHERIHLSHLFVRFRIAGSAYVYHATVVKVHLTWNFLVIANTQHLFFPAGYGVYGAPPRIPGTSLISFLSIFRVR